MMEAVIIRDRDELYEDWKRLGENFSPSLYQRLDNYSKFIDKLYQHADNYAVVEEDILMGMISFYANDPVKKTAYITEIIVDKPYQGRGIGRKLIDICVGVSVRKGMNKIRLEVKKDNTGAIHFYNRLGFRYESDKSEEAVYMYCDIGRE